MALSLTAACLPIAAYAADSTTAMRDGADGLPAGSVLCFPNNATKWRVLNGSMANNGDDGIFVLSETASTDQVNLLKKIRRESDKNLLRRALHQAFFDYL